MRHDAWRLNRPLPKVAFCFAFVSHRIVLEAGAQKVIGFNQGASTGTDLTTLPRLAAVTLSIAKPLDVQREKMGRASTEPAFAVADATIIGPADAHGCNSIAEIPFDNMRAAISAVMVAMDAKIVGVVLALALQDCRGLVAFTHYADRKNAPRRVKIGAWAPRTFLHPCDERSRSQQSAN